MTQEEILEYNKKCAEFLRFKYKNQAKFWAIYPLDNNSYLRQFGYIRMDKLKFHSDWNWIMEVVEAIQKIIIKNDDEFCIEFYEVTPNEPRTFVSVGNILTQSNNPKEAVVEAINQFLIWYNKTKNN